MENDIKEKIDGKYPYGSAIEDLLLKISQYEKKPDP